MNNNVMTDSMIGHRYDKLLTIFFSMIRYTGSTENNDKNDQAALGTSGNKSDKQ
jgi:hypothetical protein